MHDTSRMWSNDSLSTTEKQTKNTSIESEKTQYDRCLLPSASQSQFSAYLFRGMRWVAAWHSRCRSHSTRQWAREALSDLRFAQRTRSCQTCWECIPAISKWIRIQNILIQLERCLLCRRVKASFSLRMSTKFNQLGVRTDSVIPNAHQLNWLIAHR